MRSLLLAAFVLTVVVACQTSKSTEETTATDTVKVAPVALNLKWETDTVLTTCESVIYDKERDVLYVANIVGKDPSQKDGNGFISKVGLDGKVTELQWIKGLNAPKGMGLYNNKLYIADIDRVVEADVTTGKVSKTYPVDSALFLNDITVDGNGKVYISDTGAGNVVVIENGTVSKWLRNVDGPNGLLADGGRFLMLTWNSQKVHTVDPTTGQITVQADSVENLDGIEATGEGDYLMSSWNGVIHYVGTDWNVITLLDMRADSVNAADIEYIPEKKLLLVPTFFKNTVRAYEVNRK